jgi:hypothetical protein
VATIPGHENKDYTQTLKESYDPDLNRLRVEALVTDGVDALLVNGDGSINVNIVSGSPGSSEFKHVYNEITSVASATPTTVNTYIVPLGKDAFLQQVAVSGTNIATYEVFVNGVIQDKKRTYFGTSLDGVFHFSNSASDGYPLTAGDIVLVRVTHNRPSVGDFNCRLQVLEV